MQALCLTCGHVFQMRKSEEELAKPRQCRLCWSYSIIKRKEVEDLADEVARLIRHGQSMPFLDAIERAIAHRAFKRFGFFETIRLLRVVRFMAEEGLSFEEAVEIVFG